MITGKQALTRVRRQFADSPVTVWVLIFGAFLVARLVIIAGGDVFEAPDSAAYAVRNDPARDHGPLLSFVGNAPRPWGLPLFYAIFGTDSWRTIGQWALATAAWVYFAWEVSRHVQTRVARYLAVAGLLFLACLSQVASWDLAILTESLSISLGLLVLAFLLRWLRTGSRVAIGAMTATAVWWTFLRPDIRIFIVALIAVLDGHRGTRLVAQPQRLGPAGTRTDIGPRAGARHRLVRGHYATHGAGDGAVRRICVAARGPASTGADPGLPTTAGRLDGPGDVAVVQVRSRDANLP